MALKQLSILKIFLVSKDYVLYSVFTTANYCIIRPYLKITFPFYRFHKKKTFKTLYYF